MGKRKKNSQNVVKVDLSDTDFGKRTLLPVVIMHSSKDGCRVEQTVHRIPTLQQNLPPPTFNPSPVVNDAWDDAWDDAWYYAFPDDGDATVKPNGAEPVRPYFLSFIFALTQPSIIGGPYASLVRGPR